MVTCLVCGGVFQRITWIHLRLHGITIADYRDRYPGSPMFSEELLAGLSVKLKGRPSVLKGRISPLRGRLRPPEVGWKISKALAGRSFPAKSKKRTGRALENLRVAGLRKRGKKYNVSPEGRERMRNNGRRGAGKKRTGQALENVRTANTRLEKRTKQSVVITQAILEGRFHPGEGRSGHFYSAKNQREFRYRSRLELNWYQLLERLEKVKSYRVEPFAIPYVWSGSTHNYLPDLLIEFADGSLKLVEIRPEGSWARNKPQTLVKFSAARQWCSKCRRRVSFEVLGYRELTSLLN